MSKKNCINFTAEGSNKFVIPILYKLFRNNFEFAMVKINSGSCIFCNIEKYDYGEYGENIK